MLAVAVALAEDVPVPGESMVKHGYPLFNGHFRNRLIGGTYIRPIQGVFFQAYVREYPHKKEALYGTVPPFQHPEIPSDSFLIVKKMNYSHLVNIPINV